MPILYDEQGRAVGIACTRERARKCSAPGCKANAPLLCDFLVGNGTTCDRPMCVAHSKHVGKNRDYCLEHAQ